MFEHKSTSMKAGYTRHSAEYWKTASKFFQLYNKERLNFPVVNYHPVENITDANFFGGKLRAH
ncbi:hypothetical protein [Methylomonas albis]|uniref:Integrase catalytic domain-containing protein n=1 Tax=Methylomonas albis TaxID=1854563 RepID=A0ABR9D7J2_9GAMM|nr:hypothetical protein [Methylomonas albis]MBD9358721.1 hypothetical protein [Methylomonas albis]